MGKIRRERQGREIGLREMAKVNGVRPTCLSKVERDEFRLPYELARGDGKAVR